jgi:hypothetical protein
MAVESVVAWDDNGGQPAKYNPLLLYFLCGKAHILRLSHGLLLFAATPCYKMVLPSAIFLLCLVLLRNS